MTKIRLLALFGKSGSGKDTIQNFLLAIQPHKYHGIVSTTTRPIRDYEVEGVNYHYITKEEFTKGMLNDEFIEALEFNGWFYGSRIQDLDPNKINIGVFTPSGIECLRQTADEYDLEILPIYVKCSDITRLFRVLKREKATDIDELIRRYYADEADFECINFWHLDIYNDIQRTSLDGFVEIIGDYCKDFFD